jgi:hypothetical protein
LPGSDSAPQGHHGLIATIAKSPNQSRGRLAWDGESDRLARPFATRVERTSRLVQFWGEFEFA